MVNHSLIFKEYNNIYVIQNYSHADPELHLSNRIECISLPIVFIQHLCAIRKIEAITESRPFPQGPFDLPMEKRQHQEAPCDGSLCHKVVRIQSSTF